MAPTVVDGVRTQSRHRAKLARRTAEWKPGILPFRCRSAAVPKAYSHV
ncbi:hypothetical protein [Streptomyces albipurpureus]|uniref:Uncharacterized protein n=1 Tax=Streptomyces albipurpureus TaxID=2897419 RepID=A0ABT0UF99_9ACTN|nr:hypothetical protein [Streptomyces sp. CWNU-1]MCM2387277.1 hypothetical protein [Streptomyces sp. CWNU-1]